MPLPAISTKCECKMWCSLCEIETMYRSSRVLQVSALLAFTFGAGTVLYLFARYFKRKRREPSTGKSSSYNDRPLKRRGTFYTSGNFWDRLIFLCMCTIMFPVQCPDLVEEFFARLIQDSTWIIDLWFFVDTVYYLSFRFMLFLVPLAGEISLRWKHDIMFCNFI